MKKKYKAIAIPAFVTFVWATTADFSPIYMKVLGLLVAVAWIILLILTLKGKS